MKKAILTLALTTALLFPIPAQAAGEPRFSDVPPEAWFAPYVETCVDAGILEGTGEGRFSPEQELTSAECRTLAYRLYDLRRGGDGTILPAPEDWGYLSMTVAGRTFGEYTDANNKNNQDHNVESYVGWGYRGHTEWNADGSGYPGYTLPALYLSPSYWANWAWGIQDAPATMTLNGKEYPGKASYGLINSNTVQISFLPDGGEEVAGLLNDVIYPSPPTPGNWWRDIAYTLESQDLQDMFQTADYSYYSWDGPASRKKFAQILNRSAGEMDPLNQISQLPDCTDEEVLNLYRSGILTGTDSYGSFQGDLTLTRAEAAAMAARVLEPSLRLTFTPTPMPTQGYTLTYLMDGVPFYDYPVCLLMGEEDSIMLTLDGRQLPWPVEASVPSYGLNSSGDYLFMAAYDTSTENPYDTKGGLIDRTGVYVVPPENSRGMTYAVEGGFFTTINRDNRDGGTIWGLLDEQGQWVRELEVADGDPREFYPPKPRQPLRGIEYQGSYYVDTEGKPVSQPFDWGSHITEDGQGFVGIEGKIYRIQFDPS